MCQKLNDRPKHGHSKQSLASRRTRQGVFLKTKSWDFSSVIHFMSDDYAINEWITVFFHTDFFFVYPSWIYHVQLTVDLSCAKRQIILMWHSCPRRCDLLCRFSWPTGAFPDHGPGRKAWVLHQRQSAHLGRWWWSGPPLSIDLGAGRYRHFWVHGSLSQEINAVVRRIILNLEESCGAVQLWNPSEHLEFAADWQIGRTRLWFWRRRLMP